MKSAAISAIVGAVVAVVVTSSYGSRPVRSASPDSVAASSGQTLVSMMSGTPHNAALTAQTASASNVCINFQNGDDPAVNSGELWELRHLNCSGPDCLIVMMRPNYDEFIEDHPNLPSSGVAAFDPPGDGTWNFSWQTMWTTITGEGFPQRVGFSAYTCRLGGSFPNYYGFAAKGGVSAASAGSYQFNLSQPIAEFCHLDYCSAFNKFP